MTADEVQELFIAAAEIDRRCSVEGCESEEFRRGMCSAHHYRFLRYGNPLGGKPRYARNGGVCLADGCEKTATKGGWCAPHYRRNLAYGDPFAGGTQRGEPERFFRQVALIHEGDSCLLWPYGQNGEGYGRLSLDGKDVLVHRAVCAEENGPPPTPEHEAAHSCGNGHFGCISRSHLRWATPKENHSDMVDHGTAALGAANPMAKLKARDVLQIRQMYRSGVLGKTIADKFGISATTVYQIGAGKRWAWLKMETQHDA